LETHSDTRLQLLEQWLSGRFPGGAIALTPASADASFRRYFRVRRDGESWIAMDAPPQRENCEPFLKVAALLRAAGVHVPAVIAHDLELGFLLLSDLGTTTYLDALDAANADRLFRDALDALVKIQLASRSDVLPPYDEALLRRELELFPEWYVGHHLGTALREEELLAFGAVCDAVVASSLAQPRVYVHRDYMPRNLMLAQPNPGILDFQDAVYGPITYDVVSLFRDAFVSWDEERVIDWTVRYWERARRAGLPVDADFASFYRAFEWMGLQRHLKVLGIFARIRYRDGKAGYVEDTPRFVSYVRAVCGRYRELAPLLGVFDRLETLGPAPG
jgi:aminoglycoside/choline kinase family phosphotransferase